MEKIKDILDDLDCGDYRLDFEDYTEGYVYDIQAEIADSNCSIYYNDIDEFAREHSDYLKRAVDEGLAPDGKEFFNNNPDADFQDYTRACSTAGEYMMIEDEIYSHLEDLIKDVTLRRLLDDGKISMDRDELEAFENIDWKNVNRLEDPFEELVDEFADMQLQRDAKLPPENSDFWKE